MSRFTASIAAILLLASPVAALAEAKLSAELKIDKLEIVTRDGVQSTIIAESQTKTPGDLLRYQITVSNAGPDAADDVVINQPVPAELRYDGDERADTPVSVDGGESYGPISTRTVTVQSADGGFTNRPATFADVTHVRWTIGSVKPGEKISVSFRGVLK
jgi:uncharacterized repeat protein (TIGR01451 family)